MTLLQTIKSTANQLVESAANRLTLEILRYMQHSLIFKEGDTALILTPQEYAKKYPSLHWLSVFEETPITASDGVQSVLWHNDLPTDESKPVYVAIHGRLGHWCGVGKEEKGIRSDPYHRLAWTKAMVDTGAGVILVHPRGIGASKKYGGNPSDGGYRLDMAAVAEYLKNHGIRSDRVIIVGESLGGAVAVMLDEAMPKHYPSQPKRILALINSPASMEECVRDKFQLPPDYITPGMVRHPFNTQKRLEKLDPRATDLYMFHDPKDDIVLYKHYLKLKAAAERRGFDVKGPRKEENYRRPDLDWVHTSWDAAKIIRDLNELYKEQHALDSYPDHALAIRNGRASVNGRGRL